MALKEYTVKAHDGLNLLCRCWSPSDSAQAVICLVHGLGEHGGRYAHLADFFNRLGFALYATDLRGHGISEGKRGHIPSYKILMEDIALSIKTARTEHTGIPFFIFGHSMGGNIAVNYALRRDVSDITGLIISSAWFRLAFEPPAYKVKLGKLMNSIYPAFTQNNEIDPSDLSSDLEVIKAYRDDPLVHSKISASLFFNVYEAGLWALEHAENLKIPALVTHGSADRLTSPKASAEFAGRAGAELKIWEGLKHEPHNEPAHEKVLIYLKDWIVKQTQNHEVAV